MLACKTASSPLFEAHATSKVFRGMRLTEAQFKILLASLLQHQVRNYPTVKISKYTAPINETKTPLVAYMMYCQDKREESKLKNQGLNVVEMAKKLATKWKEDNEKEEKQKKSKHEEEVEEEDIEETKSKEPKEEETIDEKDVSNDDDEEEDEVREAKRLKANHNNSETSCNLLQLTNDTWAVVFQYLGPSEVFNLGTLSMVLFKATEAMDWIKILQNAKQQRESQPTSNKDGQWYDNLETSKLASKYIWLAEHLFNTLDNTQMQYLLDKCIEWPVMVNYHAGDGDSSSLLHKKATFSKVTAGDRYSDLPKEHKKYSSNSVDVENLDYDETQQHDIHSFLNGAFKCLKAKPELKLELIHDVETRITSSTHHSKESRS